MARARTICLLAALAWTLPQFAFAAGESEAPRDVVYAPTPDAPRGQLPAEAALKSAGCMSCHTATDSENMHQSPAVILGCTDCHGGDATVIAPAPAHAGAASGAGGGDEEPAEEGGHDFDPAYRAAMDAAHVQPTLPETWHYPSSANPEHSYTLLNRESPEYIRFVNPSDLRVAREACGACHLRIIQAMERHLMSTGAMLWGGASYNNGILPFKNYILGEAFTREGEAATIMSPLEPDERMTRRGILPSLIPLPPWEVVPAGDIFRVFERGGRNILKGTSKNW